MDTVAFFEGNGTTNAPKSYSFTEKPGAGKFQYRLKQIDRDEKFEYSQTVEPTIMLPAQFGLSQNYPNPFNPTTVINYSIALQSNVVLKVFDVLGKEIITLVNERKQPGRVGNLRCINIGEWIVFLSTGSRAILGYEAAYPAQMKTSSN